MSPQRKAPEESYDVAISGLGPVGLLAAILLGRQGYRVAGFERWPTPYRLPRAVTFDHEIARTLHVIGIDADSDPAINYYDSVYRWQNAAGETLMEIDWVNTAADGWRNRYWFSQPDLEDRLREIAASLNTVSLFPGFEVDGLTQDGDRVTVSYHETEAHGARVSAMTDGRTGTVQARFLIGSDGANSKVREKLGLTMTDLNFRYDWLVVDTLPHEPMTFDPPHYQVCDPARPTTVVPGGPGRLPGGPDRRRWEFMALPGESLETLGKTETVWDLLEPFGVTPATADLERAVVWRFQAKYLEEWRLGRVALAGDAAHLMPPFAGEGMCAGLRDATNLCWRLSLALSGKATLDILDGYTTERNPHIKWYLQFSVDIGRVICVTDEAEAAVRDEALRAEHRQRAGELIHPHDAVLGAGAWLAEDPYAGMPAIQGRVAYRGRAGRFDDAVGRGWFLLSLPEEGESVLTSDQYDLFASIGGTVVTVGPAGSGADVVDYAGDYTRWMIERGIAHLLVRPDFYVAATATDGSGMRAAFDSVMNVLALRKSPQAA